MKHRDRFLPIFLLSLALTAPAALPGAATAEASMKDKADPDPQYVRQNDRNDDWDDWDDWNDDWDDDDANMRFEGMDTNRDGRVTRREWRGNDRSFDNHDWNRDGVLSGTELRPGGRNTDRDTWDTWSDVWNDRFERLDRNNNGYVSTSEWTQDQRLFDRIDLNNDNRLSRSELLNLARQRQLSWDRQFTEMDVNRDGRLSLREWQRDRRDSDAFERLDRNNDGYVIRTELVNRDYDQDDDRSSRTEPSPRTEERFQHFDRNRDRLLSLSEWTGSRDFFDRLDRDNNGYLSVQEWMGW